MHDLRDAVRAAERRASELAAIGVADRRGWWSRPAFQLVLGGATLAVAVVLVVLGAWSPTVDAPVAKPGTAFPWHLADAASGVVTPSTLVAPLAPAPPAPTGDATAAVDAAVANASLATRRADITTFFGPPPDWTSWWAEQSGAPLQVPVVAPAAGLLPDAAPRPSVATTDDGRAD